MDIKSALSAFIPVQKIVIFLAQVLLRKRNLLQGFLWGAGSLQGARAFCKGKAKGCNKRGGRGSEQQQQQRQWDSRTSREGCFFRSSYNPSTFLPFSMVWEPQRQWGSRTRGELCFFSPSKIHPIFTSIKVFFSPHPNRSTFHPGGSLAANDLKQRALHGQQSEGETAGTAEGHRRRLALQVTFALTPITYYLHTRTYSKWSIWHFLHKIRMILKPLISKSVLFQKSNVYFGWDSA